MQANATREDVETGMFVTLLEVFILGPQMNGTLRLSWRNDGQRSVPHDHLVYLHDIHVVFEDSFTAPISITGYVKEANQPIKEERWVLTPIIDKE